jgi:hypothetical protein
MKKTLGKVIVLWIIGLTGTLFSIYTGFEDCQNVNLVTTSYYHPCHYPWMYPLFKYVFPLTFIITIITVSIFWKDSRNQ